MDKAPEAAAICISAFPLCGSLSVARRGSSCITAYNGEIKLVIYSKHKIICTHLNQNNVVVLNCPSKNCFAILGI